ncbi:unnamed protein product [Menidia menidia]|uniref:(Atlantic silverside) hypothetical protein n=1 Tax=Menidia menidia TaxID=238744 RepID=A0A8S4BUJ0_9TELE|nr:unnamed protein product [Menidia menidia]
MGKKRRSEVSEETDAPVKKEKVPEFNGTEFKVMLKNPTTAMKGLEKFIAVAKKLPSSDLYDVVEGYIKISMECAEIFKLLEGEKHIESEMLLIFESLEMILLRTASDLSHFSMVGNAIMKKTAANHMKLLQGSFHSINHRFVRQCLNLLSAIVSQGNEAAREVLSQIHIKSLSGLAKRRDKRGKPDVRQAFIQFVLSFLVSGDGATVGQILEIKELLPHILNTGLKEDRMSTVNLILSTLKTRVVLNKAISKTQKVRFFTPAVLASIASLYKWNGITDAAVDDENVKMDSDSAGVAVVRELVHSFLLDLCCSRKHGISFHDPSLGTAGRAGNLVLLQFLAGLKQATEDELVGELVVNVLKASPDILSRFFKETQHSYTPRVRGAWQDNVRLLKKIYEAQPDVSAVFQGRELIALPRLLSMVMVVSLPPVCNKAFFTQGLSIANSTVQLTTVSMMNFILKKAHKNMEYLLDKASGLSSDVYTADMMEELVQLYRESLGKILPDMTGIISTWQSLSKKEKADGEDKKTRGEGSAEQTEEKREQPAAAETAEVILLKALILQVICLYQKVVPHLVVQCKFDFSKLLKGIVSERGMREEVPPVLQYQVLQLALDLPASKFTWFRIQDAADTESSSGEKSVLYLLLKMFVSSSTNSHLRSSTQKLVLKVLNDTGVFEHSLSELQLWLHQLARLEPNQQEAVIQFLERVLVKMVYNSHEYTDKVASLVQEAGYVQANLSSHEGDASSIPVSHIDDVLDMLDVIMEGSEGEMEEFGPSLSEDLINQTFPFSALVPAALQARNKLPADKGAVYEYLCAVFSDVLHCQREPLPLCIALQQYDKELVSANIPACTHPAIIHLHHYYSRWLPKQCHNELFKSPESPSEGLPPPTSYGSFLKAAYIQGPNALLKETFRKDAEELLASMSLDEFPVAVKQVLLYVKSTVENFGTFSKGIGAALLKTLMEMLQDIVTKLQESLNSINSEPTSENPQEGSDLFLELNQSSAAEANKEQVVVSALGSALGHPCLEQWFLALELSALPPHSLNPVRLKLLCGLLTDCILTLLTAGAPALRDLGHPQLLGNYTGALEKAALKELVELADSQPPKTHSRTFQALLSLHTYMDPNSLREVLSRLLLLPQDSLICPGIEGGQSELSSYGRIALQILTEWKSSPGGDEGGFLTTAHLRGLSALLLSCRSPELEAFLLRTLSARPADAALLHADVLLRCLRTAPPAPPRALGALLLRNCSAHRLRFELWCLEPANLQELSSETEAFLPLVDAYLQAAGGEDPARPKEVQQEVLKVLKQALLPKLSRCVLGSLTKDSGAHFAQTLSALIRLSADADDISDLIQNLPAALQNVDSFERWQLVDVITEKLAERPAEKEEWRRSVCTAALKTLAASYSRSREVSASPSEQEQGVLRRLQELVTSAEDIAAAEWNSFVKNGLKYRYRDHNFLLTLRGLLERIYDTCPPAKVLMPLAMIHTMTSSHSQFLPIMLGSNEEPNGCKAKGGLVSLLLCLVKKCPEVCSVGHFVVLLGAYGATMCASDQNLLLLLREYERNQVSLLKFQSLLWGPAAVEHHKTRKSLGASLWKQSSSDDVLALLKADRMLQTVSKFPQQRRIIVEENKELLCGDEALEDSETLYDPCFLLPLFSAILRTECVVDCLKFVSSHALGVTVMALSSYDPKARAAAYHVLSCFYHHLEGARFREKRQLLYLMDMVRNGVRQQNQRLPFILTTYISKVAQQMLRPEDHMYVVLNRFLLSHQSLDFRRVPEFFRLFFGSDLEHKLEREWILNVLEDGISDGHCYELCSQQGIFQILLGFSSSALCDDRLQAQILRVLCRAARVTKAAFNLTKACGLLSWTVQLVDKRNLNQQLLCAAIDLLHALWFTVLRQKEKREDGANGSLSPEETPQGFGKCLPLPLINEFLSVALVISRHLRLGVKAAQLRLFVRTLCSVLSHRGSAHSANRQADWFTLRPQPLSCPEALTVLLCWASLAHNTALLTQIQSLSEKHKVKELMGTGKNKVQAKSHVSHNHVQEENLPEEATTEKQAESVLADCKPDLSRICLQWEPVSDLSEPPSHQPGGRADPRQLDTDTAHLLAKWSLRWLLEDANAENGAKEFLQWFEKVVIKHKEVVKVVMQDPGLKADLLRLYHRIFKAQSHSGFAARAETIQLFTSIMIHLLETRGQLPECHRAVVSACVPEACEDPSRRAAGCFLLSLYVHESWSGGASAEKFLSHVTLVVGDKRKRKKTSKSAKTQTALRAICNEIITMTS